LSVLNKKITQITQSQKSKREKDLLIKNAKKDLDIAKIKEQNINSMLGLISKDKEVVLSLGYIKQGVFCIVCNFLVCFF
jgi:hypothetical protein